jgi:circadian clock protein KaiC
VIKMRGGNHSKDIREYIITDKGLEMVAPRRTDYISLTSGLPQAVGRPPEPSPEPKATAP